jgi:endoglucanase
VGRKPIHLLEPDDRKKVVELKQMHIDIGARDADDARGRVRIGDVAVVDADPVELPNDRLASRALDNRLGAYVALEVARRTAEAGGAPGDVVGVASVQEETTGAGARTTAFSLEPHVAIAVDVCHATDAPGVDAREAGGKHGLGDGPVISRGTNIHPRVYALLEQAARDEDIAHTVEAAGRGTFTDADEIFATRGGVPTGLVSIPLRYMHSPVEVVQLSDVEDTVRLLVAFARLLGDAAEFVR